MEVGMKLRDSTTSLVLLTFMIVVLTPPAVSHADPILKPKKYHGPIPKRSWGLSIGFLTGADNEEMYGYLESLIEQPLRPTVSASICKPMPGVILLVVL